MNYKITKKDYKKFLRRFYLYYTKIIPIGLLIGLLLGIYLLCIGLFVASKELKNSINIFMIVFCIFIGYIISLNSYIKKSLTSNRIGDQDSFDFFCERIDNEIKIHNLSNNTSKTIGIDEISKIVTFKDFSVIVCGFRAMIITNIEMISSLKTEIENRNNNLS